MDSVQEPITGREDLRALSGLRRALAEFYAAFNNRDLEGLAQNWWRASDVVMANPVGGIVRGWEGIRAVYERLVDGQSRINVEFYDYTLHEAGEVAYAAGRERGQLRRGEEMLDLAIRTTRVYRRMLATGASPRLDGRPADAGSVDWSDSVRSACGVKQLETPKIACPHFVSTLRIISEQLQSASHASQGHDALRQCATFATVRIDGASAIDPKSVAQRRHFCRTLSNVNVGMRTVTETVWPFLLLNVYWRSRSTA
jgi:ketosteroid isomerase-like protein